MKKINVGIILVCVLFLNACGNTYVYKPGFDTKEIYGDGTFQIMDSLRLDIFGENISIAENKKCICLFNCAYNSSLIFDIINYKYDKKASKLYVYGINIYNDEKGVPFKTNVYSVIDIIQNKAKLLSNEGSDESIKRGIQNSEKMVNDNALIILKSFESFSNEEKVILYELENDIN